MFDPSDGGGFGPEEGASIEYVVAVRVMMWWWFHHNQMNWDC